MKQQPLVSIITPAYNAERFIEETIRSVMSQTYQNWEHLVVIDENSKDKTKEIVSRLSHQDHRVVCVSPSGTRGAAANRNKGLELAKGEYIAFIDADDLWTNDKLDKQINFMQDLGVDFTYTGFRRVSENKEIQGVIASVPGRLSYSDLLKNNAIACLTVVFKSEKFKDIRFQEQGWEDMSFWLQILKRIPYAYGLDEVLGFYRIVQGSRSNNKIFAAGLRWDTYRKVEHLSLINSMYLFSHYVISSLFKHARF
jgi:teichuronic acid biosynthesis glycosyltransferase TuaG